MAAKPIIVDCDPGADDAIALFLALAFPDQLNLIGITTVAGNVPLLLTQTNARKLCDLTGRGNIPVFAGCPRPLLRPLITAEEVHGKTGLDGINLPSPTVPLQTEHAVEFLIRCLSSAPKPVTLATLGPLTNLAVALIQQPAIADRIQEVVIMGGAVTHGNITPSAEFNIYVDPHAAQVVLRSGLPLTLIPLDVTHQVIATPERMQAITAVNNSVSGAAVGLLKHYGEYDMKRYGTPGAFLHDPCVIAYLLKPELFTIRPCYVEVELISDLTLGRTVVDLWQSTSHSPNVRLVETVDAEAFFQLLIQALAAYG
ncbi:Inosine-uridine nucleoside N-ribohydrolase [Leptolyngbyaceae cyanobacterium JSC-12]|nr:Inosine-uridine nucleoside N-ribohydrolase [Leptolyngbyaceae cyanobacterium JSC-12]